MQRIIILGATSGIGRALAKHYAAAGNRVGIAGRRKELLDEMHAEYPGHFHPKRMDITEIESLPARLEEFVVELGGLDLLIVASGTGLLNPALDFERELPALQTNVLGFTAAVDWGYRFFECQGRGHLVGISSIAALLGEAGAPAYSASKAYQANYLEALQRKAAGSGRNIIVTDIRPGFVDTPMAKGEGLFWVAPVEKAAGQIRVAIGKRRRVAYITRRWRLLALLLRLAKITSY